MPTVKPTVRAWSEGEKGRKRNLRNLDLPYRVVQRQTGDRVARAIWKVVKPIESQVELTIVKIGIVSLEAEGCRHNRQQTPH
jgi:hypothetical protein